MTETAFLALAVRSILLSKLDKSLIQAISSQVLSIIAVPLKMSTHSTIGALGATLIAGCLFSMRKHLLALAITTLSFILNFYLSLRYPVLDVDKTSNLPSCKYQWPNGQGDAAKFLHGQKNSEVWEKSFGAIYRIWSGMNPEVYVPISVKADVG
jgi:hypothetical protein